MRLATQITGRWAPSFMKISCRGSRALSWPVKAPNITWLDIPNCHYMASSPSLYIKGWNDCYHRKIVGDIYPSGLFSFESLIDETTGRSYTGKILSDKTIGVIDCSYGIKPKTGKSTMGTPYVPQEVTFQYEDVEHFTVGDRVYYTMITYGYYIDIVWFGRKVYGSFGTGISYDPSTSSIEHFIFGWECGDYHAFETRYLKCSKFSPWTTTRNPIPVDIAVPEIAAKYLSHQCEAAVDNIIALSARTPFALKGCDQAIWDAVENARATPTNTLQFLIELKTALAPVLAIVKAISQPNPKTISNAFLSIDFGLLPNISDVKSLVDRSKRHLYTMVNGTSISRSWKDASYSVPPGNAPRVIAGTVYEWEVGLFAYCPLDSVVLNVWRFLDSWGLWPTLGMTWDMIPYTFIVDWLLPFGDLLTQIDDATYLSSLDIRYAAYTTKREYNFSASQIPNLAGCQGEITLTQYSRTSQRCPRVPNLSFQTPSNPLMRCIEGASLIIQRA